MGILSNASESSIKTCELQVGKNGIVMKVRVETSSEDSYMFAEVIRGTQKLGLVSKERDGKIIISINSDAGNLSGEEFFDLFGKSAEVVAEVLGIEKPEEAEETGNTEQ